LPLKLLVSGERLPLLRQLHPGAMVYGADG